MASKQMEEIQKKLAALSYPRSNAPAQSLFFAGVERYVLLEWLFFKLLEDKSPFTQQSWQGDSMDRDEETSRIQHLREDKHYLSDHPGIVHVTTAQGEELCKQIGAAYYIECSSKTQQNVKAMFDATIKVVIQPPSKQKEKKKKPRRGCSILI